MTILFVRLSKEDLGTLQLLRRRHAFASILWNLDRQPDGDEFIVQISNGVAREFLNALLDGVPLAPGHFREKILRLEHDLRRN